MAIKLGNNDITLKVGSTDVSAAYLGSVLVYNPVPPEPKWIATYTGGTTSSAQCDGSSAITSGEISITNLVSVEIMDCVTEIGNNTFNGCSSITAITIPNSVTSLGQNCLRFCTSLTAVTVPDSVTSIGAQAFHYSSALTSVTIEATTPPTLGWNAFLNTTCPIYVPSASVSAYKSASGWSTYASRIQAIPEPSPQWVTFNSGDDISGLNIYGIKGNANTMVSGGGVYIALTNNRVIRADLDRNNVNIEISGCYSETVAKTDDVEYIFSNIGCSDYFTSDAGQTAGTTFQLYIYQ